MNSYSEATTVLRVNKTRREIGMIMWRQVQTAFLIRNIQNF